MDMIQCNYFFFLSIILTMYSGLFSMEGSDNLQNFTKLKRSSK